MTRTAGLLAFLVLVVGGGLVIGATNRPDGWYAALAKPSFNPPNWVFGPVWTVLYVMIAIAGWRAWRLTTTRTPFAIWVLQFILNFAWSPLFFTAQRVDLALGVVLAMLASILAFIVATWRYDRTAALLFVPYAVWVAYASLLNASIFVLNR